MQKKLRSGLGRAFTLIELLIVIGLIGIISSGVVALIDPLDKLRLATDAKVQNDLGQYATALQAYYIGAGNQAYPIESGADSISALSVLVTGGELTALPASPSGSVYYYDTSVNAGTPMVYFKLQAKKYTTMCPGSEGAGQTTPYWVWCSSTGKIGVNCGNAGVNPPSGVACP